VCRGAAAAASGRGLKRADSVREGFEYGIYAAVGLREVGTMNMRRSRRRRRGGMGRERGGGDEWDEKEEEEEEWDAKEKKHSSSIRGDGGGGGKEEEVIYELCINTRSRRVR